MWDLKHDRQAVLSISRQCQREGKNLPKFILESPELTLGLDLYYDAYWELDGDRAVGMSVGRIPWTATADYAIAHEFSEDQRSALFHFVRVLDSAYLKYHSEKSKS